MAEETAFIVVVTNTAAFVFDEKTWLEVAEDALLQRAPNQNDIKMEVPAAASAGSRSSLVRKKK